MDVLGCIPGSDLVGCRKTSAGGADDLYMDIEGGAKVHFRYTNFKKGPYGCLIIKGEDAVVDRTCGRLKQGLEASLDGEVGFVSAPSSCNVK